MRTYKTVVAKLQAKMAEALRSPTRYKDLEEHELIPDLVCWLRERAFLDQMNAEDTAEVAAGAAEEATGDAVAAEGAVGVAAEVAEDVPDVADAADSAEDAVAAEDVAEVNADAAGIIAVGAVVIRVDADTGVVDVANNSDTGR
jgi:hypothetical protein